MANCSQPTMGLLSARPIGAFVIVLSDMPTDILRQNRSPLTRHLSYLIHPNTGL